MKAGENRLAVRVRQLTKDSAFDTNDDWPLGGMYRDVWLETMPAAAYIDRVETSPPSTTSSATPTCTSECWYRAPNRRRTNYAPS